MSSTIPTRRAATMEMSDENRTARSTSRNSLSGKFRNLFRKSSPSPNRPADENDQIYRQRSSSAVPAEKTPQLRAPMIVWPFGKKSKSVSSPTTSPPTTVKEKKKQSKKSKKNIPTQMEISTTETDQFYRPTTFINDNNNNINRGPTERTPTFPNYEMTPTKGFRDFTFIDQRESSRPTILPDVDHVTPPVYQTDRSRSPSLHREYYNDRLNSDSYQISKIGMIVKPQNEYENSSVPPTATQILASINPIIPPSIEETNSYRWKNSSSPSSPRTTKSDLKSSTTLHQEVESPKLNPPRIAFGSLSSKPTDSRRRINGASSPSSTDIRNSDVYHRPLPDAEVVVPYSPQNKNESTYPGLSAILEHHFHPPSLHSIGTPNKSRRPPRFDASTTTVENYEDYHPSNSSFDGFIRPLTPQQPSISINRDDSDQPVTYRSSKTIFTRDKHQFVNGGEVRTWSVREGQENDQNFENYRTIQINRNSPTVKSEIQQYRESVGPKLSENEGRYTVLHDYDSTQSRNDEYFSSTSKNSSVRYSDETERGRVSDLFSRSWQNPENSIHEPSNEMIFQSKERNYFLKRTNSYDGLGLLISADLNTRLNPCIREIEPNSPADRIGLRKNDRILAVNGINVENVEFSLVLLLIKQGLEKNNLHLTVINELSSL